MFFLITQWGGERTSEKRKVIWEEESFVEEGGKSDIGNAVGGMESSKMETFY